MWFKWDMSGKTGAIRKRLSGTIILFSLLQREVESQWWNDHLVFCWDEHPASADLGQVWSGKWRAELRQPLTHASLCGSPTFTTNESLQRWPDILNKNNASASSVSVTSYYAIDVHGTVTKLQGRKAPKAVRETHVVGGNYPGKHKAWGGNCVKSNMRTFPTTGNEYYGTKVLTTGALKKLNGDDSSIW